MALQRKSKKVEEVKEPEKLLWRKIGGGFFIFENHMIKPGETFRAHEKDIPKAFKDSIVPVDEAQVKAARAQVAKAVKAQEVHYTLVEVTEGLWDVVNEKGKAINDEPLSDEAAVELKTTLEA